MPELSNTSGDARAFVEGDVAHVLWVTPFNVFQWVTLDHQGREVEYYCHDRIQAPGNLDDDLERRVASSDLVIEAVVERLDIKKPLFDRIAKAAPAHAILATNTSGIAQEKAPSGSTASIDACNSVTSPNATMRVTCVRQGASNSRSSVPSS